MQSDFRILNPRKTLISFKTPSTNDLLFAQSVKKNVMTQSLTTLNQKVNLPNIRTQSEFTFKKKLMETSNQIDKSQMLLKPAEIGSSLLSNSNIFQDINIPLRIEKPRWHNKPQQQINDNHFRTTHSFARSFSQRLKKKSEETSQIKAPLKLQKPTKKFSSSINIKKYKNLI